MTAGMPSALASRLRGCIDFAAFFALHLRPLRGRGAERMAFCRFHDNRRTPALSVNVEKGTFFCHACGAAGDFIHFEMRLRGLKFSDAVRGLARRYGINPDAPHELQHRDGAALMAHNNGLLTNYAPATSAVAATATPPVIDPAIPEALHEYLRDNAELLRYPMEKRGLTMETIEHYKLGYDPSKRRYTIPVYDEHVQCVNIRRYLPNARRAQDKMISWRPGYGAARLFPWSALQQPGDLYLTEGEWDTLLALQHGLRALTTTGGAGTWRAEWSALFAGRDVTIMYDADAAGRAGAVKVAQALHGVAARVSIHSWPASAPVGYDVSDWLLGRPT
jgi:DNA primase